MQSSNSDFVSNPTSIQHFHDRWNQCKQIIDGSEQSKLNTQNVFQYVDEILDKLVDEAPSTSNGDELYAGPLLENLIQNDVFECLLIWVEGNPTLKDKKSTVIRDNLRYSLISSFEKLITHSRQAVLLHRAILQPLLQTLLKLSSQLRDAYYPIFGRVLNELCVFLCRDSKLFDFCKQLCSEIFDQPYLVFSLLVPLLHRQDVVGDSSRDALLLVFVLSKHDDQLGNYLAFESDMCPVLATGLSGLYSSLPTRLIARHNLSPENANSVICLSEPDQSPVVCSTPTPNCREHKPSAPCLLTLQIGGPEWHQLTETEWANSCDLRRFLHTLDFCNLAVKISHTSVQTQLAHYIHCGFLVPVLGSALHQNSTDEVIAATAYLELILRRLTEPILIKLLLKFIMTGVHDSYQILTSLMNRLAANAVLGMVTLSLFRTILSFHCEDVMYELIFKHLLPLNHLNVDSLNPNNNKSASTLETPVRHLSWSNQKPVNRTRKSKISLVPTPACLPVKISDGRLSTGLIKSAESFLDLTGTSLVKTTKSNPPIPDLRQQTSRNRTERLNSSNLNVYHLVNENKSNSNCDNRTRSSINLYSDPLLLCTTEQSDLDESQTANLSSFNDWIEIRKTNLTETRSSMRYCDLISYAQNAKSRIRRRRAACKSWSTVYWPKQSFQINSDYELDTGHQISDFNYHLSPNNLQSHLSAEPDKTATTTTTTNVHNSDCELSLHLSSLRPVRTSSLYQLNYLDDFSDDEFPTQDESKIRSSLQESRTETIQKVSICSSPSSSSSSYIMNETNSKINPPQSGHNPFRVCRRFVCGDGRVPCTCLSNLPELLRVADSASPGSLNNFEHRPILSTTTNTDTDYELENFLAALDCLPSPGHCANHFGHLGPIVTQPKLDEDFIENLDYLFGNNISPGLSGQVMKKCNTNITGAMMKNESIFTDLESVSLDRTNCSNSSSSPSSSSLMSPTATVATTTAEMGKSKQSHHLNNTNSGTGIGLFLSILLNRLNNMHINCLFTNLLLTDIFSALASYPSPLLYGFLLNHMGLPVKQSVNTLYKVLRSVRNQISVASSSIEQWSILVQRAKTYLNCQFKRELKMTIIPDFYTAKNSSRFVRNSKPTHQEPSLAGNLKDSSTTPTISPRSSISNASSSQNRLTYLAPLFPFVYPKSFNRSSSGSPNPSNLSGNSRFHQILDITSRIASTPVLKRSSLNHLHNIFTNNNKTKFNSESDDEQDRLNAEACSSKSIPDSNFALDFDVSARIRNVVFASIIFDEFCCELAGLCYEHSLDPL